MPLVQVPQSHIIETQRCRLRAPSKEDIPHVFSATRFAGFNDGMLWDAPTTCAELEAPLTRSLEAWRDGAAFSFTIERRSDAAFLGRISIRPAPGTSRWNIGFWLHPEHQGHGYMREAARAVLDFGFRQLGAREIEACYAIWNEPSERVLLGVGMRFVEHIPHGFQKRGQWVAENRMMVTQEAWSGHAAGA